MPRALKNRFSPLPFCSPAPGTRPQLLELFVAGAVAQSARDDRRRHPERRGPVSAAGPKSRTPGDGEKLLNCKVNRVEDAKQKDAERCWTIGRVSAWFVWFRWRKLWMFHQHVNRTDSYKAQRSNIQGFPRGMSRLTRNSSSETTLLCFQTFNFMLDPYEIKPSQSQPALFLWFQKLIVNNCCQALEPLLKPFGFVWNYGTSKSDIYIYMCVCNAKFISMKRTFFGGVYCISDTAIW